MPASHQQERRHEPVEEAAWVGTLILLAAGTLLLSLAGGPGVIAGLGTAIGLAGVTATAAVFTRAARAGTDSTTLAALVGLAVLAFLARGITVWI